ncbi:hypothetical protein [Pseudoalteromonas sp. H105]|uniref:hypothetical protein n=1 Tax=Pseudoalteromonas sp. H105 TaxID=1348393 RepID=UPI0007321B4D|nr:hypothetical protein [Pseudoalteromonas sp. H105]KTF13301.1 hypothetical protein ATS75_16185 [Pseudoalteromonas sp. H105]
MNKRIFKHARQCHKWLGYLLALQIFAWLLGGLVMSAIPLEKVHGKHLATRVIDSPFTQADYPASLDSIVAQVSQPKQITYSHFLNSPIITLKTDIKEHHFDGLTGQPFSNPNKIQIAENAKAHLLIDAEISTITQLETGPREIGYKKDIWQVKFNDTFNTTLYLWADSGKVITVRSTIWRIFDFFWMLHIMDYDEREDFNNPLLISFSATSVLFCVTGIILLFQNMRLRKRRNKKFIPDARA